MNKNNMTKEQFKYFIGNEYKKEYKITKNGEKTAKIIGDKYDISWRTVLIYLKYSRMLDLIGENAPNFVSQILSGNFQVSHKNLLEISKLSTAEIKKIEQESIKNKDLKIHFNGINFSKSIKTKTEKPSVKTMPDFDLDAEVTRLILTIPIWTNSLERTKDTDLCIASVDAKRKLTMALISLQNEISQILKVIKG